MYPTTVGIHLPAGRSINHSIMLRIASRHQSPPRIRGRALQALRARLLRQNPLCVICASKGRVTLATELDHAVALCNGGTNDESNLQGLCAECHKVKTAQDKGHKPRHSTGLDGWPVEG